MHALPSKGLRYRQANRTALTTADRQRNHLIALAIAGQFGRLKAMYSPE